MNDPVVNRKKNGEMYSISRCSRLPVLLLIFLFCVNIQVFVAIHSNSFHFAD